MNHWYSGRNAKPFTFLVNLVANISQAGLGLSLPDTNRGQARAMSPAGLDLYLACQPAPNSIGTALTASEQQTPGLEKGRHGAAEQIRAAPNVPTGVLTLLGTRFLNHFEDH